MLFLGDLSLLTIPLQGFDNCSFANYQFGNVPIVPVLKKANILFPLF